MNAGSIAAERNVAGQFVDLIAERQAGSAPRLQGGTVRRGLEGMRQDIVNIEEGLQDRGAGACVARMGRGVGWVRGTSLWIGDGQQVGRIQGTNPRDDLALEDVGVDVVLPSSDRMGLDPAGEALRPEATVDLPFVEVSPLLPKQRCLRE